MVRNAVHRPNAFLNTLTVGTRRSQSFRQLFNNEKGVPTRFPIRNDPDLNGLVHKRGCKTKCMHLNVDFVSRFSAPNAAPMLAFGGTNSKTDGAVLNVLTNIRLRAVACQKSMVKFKTLAIILKAEMRCNCLHWMAP